jgi:hypothetical protein
MICWRPTVAQERWLRVAPTDPRAGSWKCCTPLKRIVFFVLGATIAALAYLFCTLLKWPGAEWLSGLSFLIVAEWLIVKRRLFASGIEESFELAALSLLVAGVLKAQPGLSHHATAGLAAAAALMAGVRTLNPLFTTLGVAALSFALPDSTGMPAALYCATVAGLALGSTIYRYRRPAYDRMVGWLTVVMPVVAYLWCDTVPFPPLPLTAALAAYSIAALTVGIVWRIHAPLFGALACAACAAFEGRHFGSLPLELRLLAGGGVVLSIAVALDYWLRSERRGFTSRQVNARTASQLDALQAVGVAALAPPASSSAEHVQGHGGSFGGGGASDNY